MGAVVYPAASAGGKTEFVTTLTSGTAYTVPAGVNFMNVILTGGGGGGNFAAGTTGMNTYPGAGGTTTFTGATSAAGGSAGIGTTGDNNGNALYTRSGNAGMANTGQGGTQSYHFNNNPNGNASMNVTSAGRDAHPGQVVTSTLNTTPGGTINYAIGAGGAAGIAFANDNSTNTSAGNGGGSGKIEVHYWA
jgi:hypothetical protein